MTPICLVIDCEDPGTPSNRSRTCSVSKPAIEQIIPFFCLFVVVRCGDPGTPSNGTRTATTFTFPNTVTYTCNEGFNLIGNRSRRCLSGGQWSGGLPTCQSKYIQTLDKMYGLRAI